MNKVSGKLDDALGTFSKTSKELFSKVANKVDDVLQSIKSSAHDLVDRLSGKFNEITSRIDDKIDDALYSMAGKADDTLNSINKWIDKKLLTFDLVPEPVGGKIPYKAPDDIKPIENLISKISGVKKTSEVAVKGYSGLKNFEEVKYDDVVATGKDAFGKTTKWVIPKGYDSVEDFLRKVSDEDLLKMGYASKDEFRETVANVEKYLNNNKGRLINQKYAGTTDTNGVERDVLGFPIFDDNAKAFQFNLKKQYLVADDTTQFKQGVEALQKAINEGKIDGSLFEGKIDASTGRIEGYIWHHNQVTGKMQLIARDVHEGSRHTGGNPLWGGGVR